MNDHSEHDVLCPPIALTTSTGLRGYVIKYAVGRENYEEYTLDLGDDERCNFWFLHKTGKPYDADFYERVKAELLNKIK